MYYNYYHYYYYGCYYGCYYGYYYFYCYRSCCYYFNYFNYFLIKRLILITHSTLFFLNSIFALNLFIYHLPWPLTFFEKWNFKLRNSHKPIRKGRIRNLRSFKALWEKHSLNTIKKQRGGWSISSSKKKKNRLTKNQLINDKKKYLLVRSFHYWVWTRIKRGVGINDQKNRYNRAFTKR